MSAQAKSTRITAALLAAGAIAMAIGGQLHPRGSGEAIDDYLLVMLESSTWNAAHIASLVGVILGAAGFVAARRGGVFAPSVRPWLTAAIVGWSYAAIETVPHLLSASQNDELRSGASTPLLDTHLALQLFATPALGLSTAALAIAIARTARTRPAWVLGGLATVTGCIYAAAGPLIILTENVAFAPMFAAQAGVAAWLIGTALRLRGSVQRSAQNESARDVARLEAARA